MATGAPPSRMERRERAAFYLFAAPWLLGFALFTAGPIVASLLISFTHWDMVSPPTFAGLRNYAQMLRDPLIAQSLRVTTLYSVMAVPLQLLVALALAALLHQPVRARGLFRTVFYLPSLVTGVAVSVLWMWLFNPQFGLLDSMLRVVHLPAVPWIYGTGWVIPSMVLMSLWGTGGQMIIFLAGLGGVPREVLDAAAIDGAGAFQRFRRITLPLLSPVILFNLVMGIIGSFQTFTQGFVMTAGGPDNASLFYLLYLYRTAFENFAMGYASAMAWLLFLILVGLMLLVFRSTPLWLYQQEVQD